MINHPPQFLEVLIHWIEPIPGLTGLCAGFEGGKWRGEQFASHLMEWLPEFALSQEELKECDSATAVRMIRKAAKEIYTTKKFENRGEFGELFLHVAIRQVFKTIPAISKIYFKDAENITVKGFDAVHVIKTKDALELWLGEVKFYQDINKAIYDVVDELKTHTKRNYLKSEFALISNKIDSNWEHAKELKNLLDINTSLDKIFDCTCIPVLLTYDSQVIKNHKESTQDYKTKIIEELKKYHENFSKKGLPKKLKVHLFLIPLKSKEEFVKCLDKGLKAWQRI